VSRALQFPNAIVLVKFEIYLMFELHGDARIGILL